MPDLCHREPEFFEVMRDCRERLVRLAEGGDGFAAILFTGSGTAAVEAAVCSVVPAGRAPGRRQRRLRRPPPADRARHGIPTGAQLRRHHAGPAGRRERRAARGAALTHVAVVHHETTTGASTRSPTSCAPPRGKGGASWSTR